MNMQLPDITCVVIGINTEETLAACIESIMQAYYPKPIEVIYCDGGSKDRSVAIAKNIEGIKVLELGLERPTPGKGRNAGWRSARGEWIHFFDSDVVVCKDWMLEAVNSISEDTAAIFGRCKELYPEKNWFHTIADIEWTPPKKEARFFGGNVMIMRSVLEDTGGFDEDLCVGEDPELSARIRQSGWNIKGVDFVMCRHDIRMKSFSQYFKRSFRSGYGYAGTGIKMLKYGEKTWFLKMMKVMCKTGILILLMAAAAITGSPKVLLLAVAVFFFPFVKIFVFKKRFGISLKKAAIYSLHCSVALLPQVLGMAKYFCRRCACRP